LRAVIDIIWISSSSNGNSSKENKIWQVLHLYAEKKGHFASHVYSNMNEIRSWKNIYICMYGFTGLVVVEFVFKANENEEK
jgi:hypothetical protein